MSTGAIFWLILFGVSALLFFGVALVVTIRGMGDLRELLSKSANRRQPSQVDRG